MRIVRLLTVDADEFGKLLGLLKKYARDRPHWRSAHGIIR